MNIYDIVDEIKTKLGLDVPVHCLSKTFTDTKGDYHKVFPTNYLKKNCSGFYSHNYDAICLNLDVLQEIYEETGSMDPLWAIVLHEFGHALGIPHIKGHPIMADGMENGDMLSMRLTKEQKDDFILDVLLLSTDYEGGLK